MGEEREEGALTGRRLGTYDLLRLIGAGGMAEVYLAQDLNLERQVAVKVLPHVLAADPAYVARFRDEARRVANLNHPHIVPVYTAGEQDGLLYMVMPFLPESLRDRVDRAGQPSPAQAVSLVLQIADALAAAHQVGIIHRDVKPENILIDGDAQAVLTDFGVAREVRGPLWDGQRITHVSNGFPVGTPEYMAPEQFFGGKVGPEADIYALGTVLYELLVGYPPREADNPEGIISLTLARRPIVPPAQRNPGVWPTLNGTVMVALEYEPQQRFPTMEQFRYALAHALASRDEPARPAGAPQTVKLAAAPPTPRAPAPSARLGPAAPTLAATAKGIAPPGGQQGDGQATFPVPPVWPTARAQGDDESWRRLWRTGLVAFLVLGIAGASLVGILHARQTGRATPPSALTTHGSGGTSTGTATNASSGPTATVSVGVNGIPLTTQQAATATARSAPGSAATSTPSEASPTSTPVPLLTYLPPNPGTGGPADQTMPKASKGSGGQLSCSVSLKISNSTGSQRDWRFTAGPTGNGWSYSVQGSSLSPSLPYGTIQAYASNTITITYTQPFGPGNTCSGGGGFAPVQITVADEAAAQSWTFTISHS